MELKIFELENPIKFSDSFVNVLEIQNLKLYRSVVARFYQVFNGIETNTPFSVTKDGKFFELKKDFCIIQNPFDLTNINKAVSTKLIKYIIQQISSLDKELKLTQIIEDLKNEFNNIFIDLDLDLEYNADVGIAEMLKTINPKLSFEDYNNISGIYQKLFNVSAKLNAFDLIILINAKQYLTEEELIQIYKSAKIYNLNILVLEPTIQTKILPYENKLLVDEDLFEQTLISYV